MENTDSFEICKTLVKNNIGSLKGLKPELKDTVCNVYLKEVENEINSSNGSSVFETESFSSSRTDLLNRMIKSLNEIRETESKKEVNFITQLILDEMKYGIADAHKYSEINRLIKRVLRRKSVDEIKDLYKSFE